MLPGMWEGLVKACAFAALVGLVLAHVADPLDAATVAVAVLWVLRVFLP